MLVLFEKIGHKKLYNALLIILSFRAEFIDLKKI